MVSSVYFLHIDGPLCKLFLVYTQALNSNKLRPSVSMKVNVFYLILLCLMHNHTGCHEKKIEEKKYKLVKLILSTTKIRNDAFN